MRSDPTKPALRAWSDEIDSLLGEQLRRIRTRFVVHGAGWMVAAAAACVVVYFLLDVGLELPRLVRLVVSAGIAGFLVYEVRRRLLYPLHRAFGRSDVAIAIERRFPELRERLVSAFQLKASLSPEAGERALRDQSAAMVERVVADAAATARALPLTRVLSPERTVKVWSAAGGFLFALLLAMVMQATQFGVFLQRAVGLGVDYPRRTRLFLELPEAAEAFRLTSVSEDRVDILMSTGDDLPVLVRAEGVVPREAWLVVSGGRGLPSEVTMTQRPGDRFRYVFRRVQGEFSFHARGGDDPRGDLEVFVRTIDPPQVGTIETELTFPAYTGLPPEKRTGGAIEALIGTDARVAVSTTAPVVRAVLKFVDSGAELELTPVQLEDDSGFGTVFSGRFAVTATDRYQVELVNAEGLGNPRPGTYPILALEDHAPVGRVLVPGGDDVNVVLADAKLPVRLEARDDFGIAEVTAVVTTGRTDTQEARLPLLEPSGNGPIRETVLTALVDIPSLGPTEGPRQGDVIGLAFELTDNRDPEHNRTELSRRQVHVVDPVELARRISSHFRRVREQVESALDQQRGQRDALESLLEDVPDPTTGRDPRLVSLQVGQARIVATMRRVREGLMRAYDVTLFNGLEGADSIHAPRVQELYLRFHREQSVAEAYVPGFYRLVGAEQDAGRIGPMEKALDPILEMTLRSDRVVEQDGREAVDALDTAGIAPTRDRLQGLLGTVAGHQQKILTDLEALLAQLDEWNEFQDVIQQARAIRDAQKDIEYRTRNLREDGGRERR